MEQMAEDPTATVAQARQWASALESLAALIGQRFPRAEPRQRAVAYVQGLVSPIERKNGWQLAEHAGDMTPYGMQHLLGRAAWREPRTGCSSLMRQASSRRARRAWG